ncbi:uncharacterized protein LOC123309667 [Coccinella septempunctata]|uniref:uncharacterized protein LOC123309667 n=1 Tax=Coccinella septempunctata TaxID=41139 RepID=UPI001D094FC1|nr:uncharacterized protein LOC123309667 [Coccinella septempunctata]
MATAFARPKLSINRTGGVFSPTRSVQPKSLPEKNKGVDIYKSNKFRLDHSLLEPDSQFTYLQFLENNPLKLSIQKLNGKMEYKSQKRLDLDKIEETYWSQWKPNKNGIFMDTAKIENKNKPIVKPQKSTRGEGDRNYNLKNEQIEVRNETGPLEFKQSKPLSKIDELTEDDRDPDTSSSTTNVEEPKDFKFLRHTDSFILNSKKQSEEKPHFQQPRCIRLYKKNSSGSYIKGGSYPLKPCLKKESTFKGYNRRPLSGTPYSASIFKSVKNKIKPK